MKNTLNQCCITYTLSFKITNFKSQDDTIVNSKRISLPSREVYNQIWDDGISSITIYNHLINQDWAMKNKSFYYQNVIEWKKEQFK